MLPKGKKEKTKQGKDEMHEKNDSKKTHAGRYAVAVLTVTALPLASLTRPQKEVKAASVTLQNPRIVKDDSMEAGQKVTWDCIYFGSYPQREIVADKDTYQAIYGESADFDKDAIEDEMLSEKTENRQRAGTQIMKSYGTVTGIDE
mgnify:CR=1 FL=1